MDAKVARGRGEKRGREARARPSVRRAALSQVRSARSTPEGGLRLPRHIPPQLCRAVHSRRNSLCSYVCAPARRIEGCRGIAPTDHRATTVLEVVPSSTGDSTGKSDACRGMNRGLRRGNGTGVQAERGEARRGEARSGHDEVILGEKVRNGREERSIAVDKI
jgi:hypothetical protein